LHKNLIRRPAKHWATNNNEPSIQYSLLFRSQNFLQGFLADVQRRSNEIIVCCGI